MELKSEPFIQFEAVYENFQLIMRTTVNEDKLLCFFFVVGSWTSGELGKKQ